MEAEKKIILKAKKDIKAFDYLYRKYFPKINSFVFHRVNDESDKNDIVSNVFFKAMKRLPVYRFKGKLGVAVGGGILLIHGGAIAITSINLGICFLLTSGLSVISGILGITFPFAAYTTAAVVGGYIIQAGGFLASPVTAIPLLGIATFLIYKKIHNKQFINLAGINYIIETKKILEI